jgi:diguanylate cyclase (GGDEF)-like protein
MKDPFKTGKLPSMPLRGTTETTPARAPLTPTGSIAPRSSTSSSPEHQSNKPAAPDRETERMLPVADAATRGKDRATLTVLAGINAGQVYALDGTEHLIGRGTDADVWVEDSGVSRHHARVTCRADGRYFVEDLGSTNGTLIGSQRIKEAEIHPGDRLQIGPHVTLRFQITDDAEEELQRRLYESSTRDALTRLYNRKYFGERLLAEVAYSRRHGVKLAVLILDLDDFKATNDTYGHLAGDMVLRLVANQMLRVIRVEDLLARYGGEEFVILARTTGKTEALRLSERILQAIRALDIPVAPDRSIRCTVSIGVAVISDVTPDGGPTELLALADAQLYRAKAEGKNRACAVE